MVYTTMCPQVLSVNVGRPAPLRTGRRMTTSAIVKRPVEGRVAVRRHNVAGDQQADPENHGGEAQAVYAYAIEDVRWWERELGRELGTGFFGENLTLAGVEANEALIGERWRVGTAELQVTCPRIPCLKLAARVGDVGFVKRFARAGRPGPYLAVVREGELAAGDAVEVLERPEHGVTVRLMLEATVVDREKLPLLAPARPYYLPKVAEFLDELERFRLDGE
jgi:MOSC domain-containing protein YiiM